MNRQGRGAGLGLGLGIGIAAGAGGVLILLVIAVVTAAVLHGPARSQARSASGPRATATATPSVPSTVTSAAAPATAPAPPDRPPANKTTRPAPMAAATLYKRAAPAVVRIEVRDDKFHGICVGSGFFVSADGLLVTNHHVIEGGAYATVETGDGTTFFVEGVAADDPTQDLALLKVKTSGMAFLELALAPRPPVGTRVFAIGHPMGVRNTVLSEGLVSGVGEALGGDVASIQTTAPISTGSSGGPLITTEARVVGVITATRRDAQNLNFAVPVSLVYDLIGKGRSAPLKPMASAGATSLDREQSAVMRRAWAAIDRRDLREAASILSDARPQMLGSTTYWVTAGALHMELKNYSVAAEAYQNAVRLKPDAVESHAMLGVALVFQQKHREAIKAFEAAAKLAPRDPKYYAAAGRCHMELKQPDRAVAFYKKAMQLAPNDAAYTGRLGDAYFALAQYADAMIAYEKAIKINPTDADTHYLLAAAYGALRRPEESLAELNKTLSLNPSHAAAHFAMGMAHLDHSEVPAALLSFQAAAKLDPAGKVGQDAAALVAKIQAKLDQDQAQAQALRQRQQAAQPNPQPPAQQPGRPRPQ